MPRTLDDSWDVATSVGATAVRQPEDRPFANSFVTAAKP